MLLRNLSHAHIVSYKTSFVDKGELIIIMEFCESKFILNIYISVIIYCHLLSG